MSRNDSTPDAQAGEPASIDVAILAVPQSSASVVFGMFDLFASAGRDWQMIVDRRECASRMRVRIVSADGRPMRVANGVHVVPNAALRDCPTPALICVPEVAIAPDQPPRGTFDHEIAWLRDAYEAGATLATACSGAVLLAEAGLLAGQEATTHWAYCDLLRDHYADISVNSRRALVVSGEGGRLVMAGGGTSWLDLALYLIARTVGIDEAMQVARVNLIDWHEVGEQPFARLARTRQTEDAQIARVQTWIADHYASASPVAAMGRESGLAERSFKRRFQQATGMTPLDYVHTLRLEEAKQMLEASTAPIEQIAEEVGYEDAGFFSRLFKRQVALTPTQYRRRFGALRRALQQPEGVVSAR